MEDREAEKRYEETVCVCECVCKFQHEREDGTCSQQYPYINQIFMSISWFCIIHIRSDGKICCINNIFVTGIDRIKSHSSHWKSELNECLARTMYIICICVCI